MGSTLRHWGVAAWRVVGVIVAAVLSYALIAAFSGLIVPMVLAVVIGALGVPVVDRLESRRVPRSVGALVFIVAVVVLLTAVAVVMVRGVIDEATQIKVLITDGVRTVDSWVGRDGTGDAAQLVDRTVSTGRPLLTGAASWATTIFSSAISFLIGTFLALFILFYLLIDWSTCRTWLAGHLGVSRGVGTAIVDDAIRVVRNGFVALTVTSLITASIIGLAAVVLGLPLALAITLVTFASSYVPYLGAILSGVFAFLIALGAGGARDAVILLIVIILVQSVVQTIVGNRITSQRLKLHPIASIVSSVCGVALAGLLGAMLSAPALALAVSVRRRTRVDRAALADRD